ncbi:M13 family metallopeptidase [Dyella nitratireducens]|uniref:Peptidase M13 n=1 Tax=Dyella nitratireducens TaxID=1849580 RepID=A0ABQ1FZA1_9GAMM|nr:M13 family metallopeptidase [Dyella nitratireducens]GGA34389.1 peptidase M13 [Dyella nitratireducens]GLQ40858.1 peptidase M13 [Dyella nitratireducens]
MQRFRWILSAALVSSTCALAVTPAIADGVPAAKASHTDIGIDLKGVDHTVKPGDNFFDYANGVWVKNTQIPADRSGTGTFLQVYQLAEKQTSQLIRNLAQGHAATGSNERKIADYYAAYMNEANIDKLDLTPLKPAFERIDAIKTRDDLASALGSEMRSDVDPINATNFHTEHLFGLFVTQGLEDSSRNMAYLLQGGIAMPSRDYYLSQDKDMVEARTQYQTYVTSLLKLAGTPDAETQAKAIIALETKIAQAQESLVDSQDVHKANNVWNIVDFAQKAPGLNWDAYFKAAGLDNQKQIDVWQPSATIDIAKLVSSEPLETWKQLLRYHALDSAAPLLPKAYADLSFNFYGTTLQGTPKQQDRWKRAVTATNTDLGDAVGQLYVKHYFPPAAKAKVEELVKNIVSAFNERLDTLAWMTPATRAKAKEKIATLRVSVGYPDTWRDYSTLEISADDPLGNHERAEALEYKHQLAKLSQPVDKGEWWMTPQTVNAVNLPLQNALNFPAAILQPPFFDPNSDAAANYGAIGAIIGHEISHSFDNTGADFDAQGRMENWWTPEDAAHFQAATQKLVKQYDQYEALPGLHVSGQQTLGENIADVSGLTAAYAAYHKSLGGKPAPVIDGLTGDQRFFLSFGQAWRSKIRDAALRQRLATDVHAPAQFRALTVRNIDGWYDAFDVKPGEKLYLAPDDRVKIW